MGEEKNYYTEKDLIKDIANLHNLKEKEVAAIYKSMTNLVEYNLEHGKLIRFRRLFRFKARHYNGRVLRDYLNQNPDKVIVVKPKYALSVIPSTVLKDAFSRFWNKKK